MLNLILIGGDFHIFFETPRNEAAFILSDGLLTQRVGVRNPRLSIARSDSLVVEGAGEDDTPIDAIPFFGVAENEQKRN